MARWSGPVRWPCALFLLVFVALTAGCYPTPSARSGAGSNRSSATPSSGTNAEEATAEEVFTRTNAERRAAGVPALTRNVNLMVAARIQASQMANRNLMSHEIPDAQYPTLRSRLAAVSYPTEAAGENIAAGYESASQAVAGWMRSSGHRANILSTTFTELGTSVAWSRSGKPYYAQVFGRPR